MISRHDKTKQNEGHAAANQPAQSKAKRPAVPANQAQVAGGSEHAGQIKTYQAMADEHVFALQSGKFFEEAGEHGVQPITAREKPVQKRSIHVTQLLKGKGKATEIAAAAKRCKFDPEDPALEQCWDAASTLSDFRSATENAAAFARYEESLAPAAAPAPVVVAPVFVEPDEAGQRAQFALEAAKVNWKAGHPLMPENFSGAEIRAALPDVVKILKNTFHNENRIGTLAIRQEKNAAMARLEALFEEVKQRLLDEEAEDARDAAFIAGRQALLALPAVQGNAIVRDVVSRLQRSGRMDTAVVPGTHTQADIAAAVTAWLSLIPQLPAVITSLNVPGGMTIKRKVRVTENGAQVRDYNKNLICHADNNLNNFHINADPALVAAIEAVPTKEVAL